MELTHLVKRGLELVKLKTQKDRIDAEEEATLKREQAREAIEVEKTRAETSKIQAETRQIQIKNQFMIGYMWVFGIFSVAFVVLSVAWLFGFLSIKHGGEVFGGGAVLTVFATFLGKIIGKD